MKKLMFLAAMAVSVATMVSCDGGTPKASLKSDVDSVSYAIGMAQTQGLKDYLVMQLGVDTAYMADFVTGLRQGIAQQKIAMSDAQEKARILGGQIANQLMQGMLPNVRRDFTDTPDTLIEDVFFRGFTDALSNDTTIFKQSVAEAFFHKKQEANKMAKDEKLYGPNRDAGRKFLAENAKKEGVVVMPSGLQYKVLVQGTGDIPQKTEKVKVNYEGRLIDGKVFDSSYKRGEPTEFRPDQVIKGWTEALTMMPVGSKWQLYIPYELAYGERDMGEIKPYSALIFDVEMVSIDRPKAEEPQEEAPADKKSKKSKKTKKSDK
jgi:FKBP-type peptidyl-prolyl cis-trans isomerase FklB